MNSVRSFRKSGKKKCKTNALKILTRVVRGIILVWGIAAKRFSNCRVGPILPNKCFWSIFAFSARKGRKITSTIISAITVIRTFRRISSNSFSSQIFSPFYFASLSKRAKSSCVQWREKKITIFFPFDLNLKFHLHARRITPRCDINGNYLSAVFFWKMNFH